MPVSIGNVWTQRKTNRKSEMTQCVMGIRMDVHNHDWNDVITRYNITHLYVSTTSAEFRAVLCPVQVVFLVDRHLRSHFDDLGSFPQLRDVTGQHGRTLHQRRPLNTRYLITVDRIVNVWPSLFRAATRSSMHRFVSNYVYTMNARTKMRGWTSSSAVAERPRDASRLSVVSFNRTMPRAQSIISYFGFRFTDIYN